MTDERLDPPAMSIAAVLRELRRSLAELEAAEEVARQRRRTLMVDLDELVERVQAVTYGHRAAEQAAAEAADAAPAAATGGTTAPLSATGEVPRVLIADDSGISGKLALRLVERMGFAVDWVRDGVEALETLGERHYDVVLMDCKMPRMDGYQATRAIRQLPGEASSIPVIALTANNLAGDDLRCFVAGMDDYLAKPVHSGQSRDGLDLRRSGSS